VKVSEQDLTEVRHSLYTPSSKHIEPNICKLIRDKLICSVRHLWDSPFFTVDVRRQVARQVSRDRR
jgi:hypothetical protein